MKTKDITVLTIFIGFLLLSYWIPSIGGLSVEGIRTLALTFGVVLLLVTEVLPVGLIAILAIVLQYILGLTDSFAESVHYFATPILFFMIAAFGLATAMTNVPLTYRILRYLMCHFGKNIKGIVTAILATTAILSSIIANLPALILLYGISLDFLKIYDDEKDRRQTGKSLCIGLVMAAAIGGIATPVGNMPMMMGVSFLDDAGYRISFIEWMCFGVPIAVILFIIMRFILFKIHPPKPISNEKCEIFIQKIDVPEKLTKPEKWVLVIFAGMMICWLLNAVIPAFDVMLVTVVGACLLLFPPFKIMTWDDFSKNIGWPVVLLTGALVSLCGVLTKNGVTEWILHAFMQVVPEQANISVMIALLGVFICSSLLVISNGPALISIFGVPVIGIALALGFNPILLVVALSFFTTYSFVLPIDSISLITYASGHYKMGDMVKTGGLLTIAAVVIMSAVIPLIGNVLGFI